MPQSVSWFQALGLKRLNAPYSRHDRFSLASPELPPNRHIARLTRRSRHNHFFSGSRIVIVLGPTGVGKSFVACALAQKSRGPPAELVA